MVANLARSWSNDKPRERKVLAKIPTNIIIVRYQAHNNEELDTTFRKQRGVMIGNYCGIISSRGKKIREEEEPRKKDISLKQRVDVEFISR